MRTETEIKVLEEFFADIDIDDRRRLIHDPSIKGHERTIEYDQMRTPVGLMTILHVSSSKAGNDSLLFWTIDPKKEIL